MAGETQTESIVLPGTLAAELEILAREQGITQTELIERMADSYRRSRAEERVLHLQRGLASKFRAAGLRTDEDVDDLVVRDRHPASGGSLVPLSGTWLNRFLSLWLGLKPGSAVPAGRR